MYPLVQLDLLSQHEALLFLLSIPECDGHLLLSDTVQLLAIYRKVSEASEKSLTDWFFVQILYMRRCKEEDLYTLLYPHGWCLLDHLEERHRFVMENLKYQNLTLNILAGSGETSNYSTNLTELVRYA